MSIDRTTSNLTTSIDKLKEGLTELCASYVTIEITDSEGRKKVKFQITHEAYNTSGIGSSMVDGIKTDLAAKLISLEKEKELINKYL